MSDANNSKYATVTTACADDAEAGKIAEVLLGRKLAACVQTLPIGSRYVWKGEMRADREVLLLIKCRRDRYADIERAILENHSYELPEILLTPVLGGYDKYLEWMDG
jgi:periplasmic divalent cation tolerance protein